MKTTKLFSGLLGLALGLGLSVSISAAPAVVEKGEGSLAFDEHFYSDCLGEWAYEIASVTYNYHLVLTPKGDYVYRDLWLNLSSVVTTESGTVWTLKKNVSPFVDRSTGGGGTLWTTQLTYVSDTGQTQEIRRQFHISFDANGALRVDRFTERCWFRD